MAATVVLLSMGILMGCSKDEILGTYNHAIQVAGDAQLTVNCSIPVIRTKINYFFCKLKPSIMRIVKRFGGFCFFITHIKKRINPI